MKKLSAFILIMSMAMPALAQSSLELKVKSNYLNLPVTYNADKATTLELVVDGKVVRKMDIYLPDGKLDFWTYLDVSKWQGKDAVLRTAGGDEREGLNQVSQSDKREYMKNVYQEKYRPQLHFSTKRGWINDPNGLVYYDGKYHLFFQHNPYGFYWGQPNWGHAVSFDLVHWEQLPDAIYRGQHGGIFSGSTVIDSRNTSGFQKGDNEVMVAFYTTNTVVEDGTAPTQNIAYSNDKGKTWTKYKGNPVIGDRREELGTYNYRDPKVFWHEETEKWVMAVYERIGISIFTSDDLKNWEYQSHTETFWETPELFELPVDGDPDNTKWVMYSVSGDYMIGDFDGKKFTKESGIFNYIRGKVYAPQLFNNVPEEDGRKIQFIYAEIPGWGPPPYDGMAFNGMQSFPTRLTLRTTPNGVRMFSEPVKEIQKLHGKSYQWSNLTAEQANEKLQGIETKQLHVKCEIENINAIGYSITFGADSLYYGLKKNLFHYNEGVTEAESYKFHYAPDLGSNTITYEFIVDHTSLEVFVDEGRFSMILPRKLNSEEQGIRFEGGDGMQEISDIKINNLEVSELKTIWDK